MKTVEKFYMACDSCQESCRAEYGPFYTSAEAEKYARQLGWRWVLVYCHEVVDDVVVDVKTRFFEIADDIDVLRAKFAGVTPMSDEMSKFFAAYEKQMEEPVEARQDVKL